MKTRSILINKLLCFFGIFISVVFLGSISAFAQNILYGNPSNYHSLLSSLTPGDTLILEAGTYNAPFRITGINGAPGNHITITGPESGPTALILGSSNTGFDAMEIRDSSYLTIKYIEIDCQNLYQNPITSKTVTHDITIENMYLHDFADSQQTVGISANHAPSWNWIIRNNIIHTGGTGIYLGDSPGSEPFINGIIENNLIYDTIGYNMEIKHQREIYRPDDSEVPGIPMGQSTTIIRNNVFRKNSQTSSGGGYQRPNLLVGHFPDSGPGSTDEYHIYGNLFLGNPVEASFQGEGTLAFYSNIIFNSLNSEYSEVVIQPHKAFVRNISVFNNSIVSVNAGIYVSGGDPAYEQKVIGNAVFASLTPISAQDQTDNIVDTYSNAANYLNNPYGQVGVDLDLYPKPGMLTGSIIDTSSYNTFIDWDKDFNFDQRDGTFRGAYAGEGNNPGWQLNLERKPSYGTPPILVDYYCDTDGDQYFDMMIDGTCTFSGCIPPGCQADPGDDCDDNDPDSFPGNPEICDEKDNDCDGFANNGLPDCYVVNYVDEDYYSGLPAGWTIIDNAGTLAVWRFDDPADRGNLTGGSGIFAIVDSDYEDLVDVDTELRTPIMDMSNLNTVMLEFKTDFRYYSSGGPEVADVDISIDGGTTWIIPPLWSKSGSDYRGPHTEMLDISAYAAGQSNVMIRFHYYNANYDWWWQIDDVHIIGTAGGVCAPSIRIRGNPNIYYTKLQSAYDAALNNDIIQCQDVVISEDIYIDNNKAVTLEGGYDCSYTTTLGNTTLNGSMSINEGTLNIESFILQ